jgi:hypothetical protein
MCRYTIPGLLVPKFYTGTYQHILYPFIFFHFLTMYSCFSFKKYTGTSKFPFRPLLEDEQLVTLVQSWFRDVVSPHRHNHHLIIRLSFHYKKQSLYIYLLKTYIGPQLEFEIRVIFCQECRKSIK